MNRENNWLKRQIENAKQDYNEMPSWMKPKMDKEELQKRIEQTKIAARNEVKRIAEEGVKETQRNTIDVITKMVLKMNDNCYCNDLMLEGYKLAKKEMLNKLTALKKLV